MGKDFNRYYKFHPINSYITAIEGTAGELCYLICGTERALLIDGCTGMGSVREAVESLTDLPVTIALTHGHLDHIAASFEYGECLIHPDDIRLLYEHIDPDARYEFANRFLPTGEVLGFSKDEMIPFSPIRTLPIYDGDQIDLGGITIEVIHVPGHSYGSVVYLDRTSRLLISGDALNVNTLLDLPGSATIEEFRDALLHLNIYRDLFDGLYGGHDYNPIPTTVIDEGLVLCERIMNRTDDHLPYMNHLIGITSTVAKERIPGTCQNVDGTIINIVYLEDRIKKSGPGFKL